MTPAAALRRLLAWRRILAIAACVAVPLAAGGCSGGGGIAALFGGTIMSEADETAAGARAHPSIMRQYGGSYEELGIDVQVARLTAQLVRASSQPRRNYILSVLDTPIVNAFATPGGYLYVTRGLLALVNDEDELASVMAHEMGHVTARHSAKRHTEAVKAGIVSGVLGALAGDDLDRNAMRAETAGYLESYSRAQELEADRIGIQTAARAGYDPGAAASFLRTMQRNFDLRAAIARRRGEPGASRPAGSHPASAARIGNAAAIARSIAGGAAGRARRRNAYLDAIDGLLFGANPESGVVRGREFVHPRRRFAFTAPPGFDIKIRANGALARGPLGSAMVFDYSSLPPSTSLRDYMIETWADGLELERYETLDLNGMKAVTAVAVYRGFHHRLFLVRGPGETLYRFVFVAQPDAARSQDRQFRAAGMSLRRLGASQARAFRPLRIRVVTVKDGETVQTLAGRMKVADFREQHFRVLNRLNADDTLRPGQRVKIIAH